MLHVNDMYKTIKGYKHIQPGKSLKIIFLKRLGSLSLYKQASSNKLHESNMSLNEIKLKITTINRLIVFDIN